VIHSRTSAALLVATLLVVAAMGPGLVGAQSDDGQSTAPTWASGTLADIETMADRYNAALDRGADARLTGERVTLRVRSSAAGNEAVYHFTIDGDGYIRGVAAGQHPNPTVAFSTSRGTVVYLATAPNPTRAFESVFVELGAVEGQNVTTRGGDYYIETTDPSPERIDAIQARGIGLVNGIRWAVVSFVRGLGIV
jgi:hypothetical protein